MRRLIGNILLVQEVSFVGGNRLFLKADIAIKMYLCLLLHLYRRYNTTNAIKVMFRS